MQCWALATYFNIIIMMVMIIIRRRKRWTLKEKERKELNYANRALRRWSNEKRKLRGKMWVENELR